MKMEFIAIGILIIFIAAFAYVSSSQNHDWGGADGKVENVISELTGGTYHPWAQPVYSPPSTEVESLLFALQAAIGSLIIGYFLGYYRAVAKMKGAKSVPEHEGKSDA